MVSHKNAKKARKPIETTLGRAPVKPNEKETDISHLRKPIETSVSGLKQVISVFENATSEVKDFLMFECDVMYECRICRTIFRSLANFILHKRNFCKDKFSPLSYINNNNDSFMINVDHSKNIKRDSSPLGKVVKKLHEIEQVQEAAKQCLIADLSDPGNEPVRSMDDNGRKASSFNTMVLEKIDSNDSGIFQTLVESSTINTLPNGRKRDEFMKSEVMEIHKKIENDVPVLDAEGKICGFTSNKLHHVSLFPKSEFKCSECNNRFATQKSLTNHIKCVHNPSRIIYICPTCKDAFANPWCVYRHLLKVHRMTNKQVRRMREQVHNSWIRRGEETSIQKKKPPEVSNQSNGNSENQWINAIEDDKDFQMCAGCGKHFERKAALHSHSQMCAKRLEICLNIKENAKRKDEEEAVERAKLDKMVNNKSILKGASKRKGKNICSYRKIQNDSSLVNNSKDEDRPLDNTTNKALFEQGAAKTLGDNVGLSETLSPKNVKPALTSTDNNSEEILHPTSTNECCKNLDQTKRADVNDTSSKASNVSGNVENMLPFSLEESASVSQSNNNNIVGAQLKLEEVFLQNEVYTGIHQAQSSRNSTPGSNSSRNSSKDVHWDEEVTNKSDLHKSCHPQSNSFGEDREGFLASPSSSSCQIISRSNSPEEAVCLSNSDDSSLQEKMEIPSSSDNSTLLIKGENPREEIIDPLSLDSVNSNGSVCIISDSYEDQADVVDPLLETGPSHLFSNDVSFKTFAKNVATAKTGNDESSYDADVTLLRKRKRKLKTREQSINCSENATSAPEYSSDNEDDVIFVGQTAQTSHNFHDSKNGFPGFSSEETSRQTSFSIDFSNLSYNNPLKSKTKESSAASHTKYPAQNIIHETDETQISKTDDRIAKDKAIISRVKDPKNLFHFISRAASYMDREKLLCIPCGLTFRIFSLLLWHMSAHFSWFRFQCSKCSFISFNKYDCMSHARKDHNLRGSAVSRHILPLPSWKTVLMSHEFRLLEDCNDIRGKHTDEKIGFEESHDDHVVCAQAASESDSRLFGESSIEKPCSGIVIEKDNAKKRFKLGKSVIDIQETTQDCQKLPEPVELAMPADVSEIFKTFVYDEETSLYPEETIVALDHYADESNDDWGLSKVCEFEEPIKTKPVATTLDSIEETRRDEIVSLNIRPSRIRTKVKQDDFVYYDNDINNVLKVTDLTRSSSQKNRSDGVITVRPKSAGKNLFLQSKKRNVNII